MQQRRLALQTLAHTLEAEVAIIEKIAKSINFFIKNPLFIV